MDKHHNTFHVIGVFHLSLRKLSEVNRCSGLTNYDKLKSRLPQ